MLFLCQLCLVILSFTRVTAESLSTPRQLKLNATHPNHSSQFQKEQRSHASSNPTSDADRWETDKRLETKSPPYANKTLGTESIWAGPTATLIPPPGNATQQNLTAEAYACQANWIAYSAALATLSYSTPHTRSTWSVPIGYGDIYTTIDGIPVAHGTLTSTGSTWMTTTMPLPHTSYAVDEEPSSPECFISMDICSQMHETYMQSLGLTLYVDKDPKIDPIPTNSPRCILAPFPLDQDGDGTSVLGRKLPRTLIAILAPGLTDSSIMFILGRKCRALLLAPADRSGFQQHHNCSLGPEGSRDRSKELNIDNDVALYLCFFRRTHGMERGSKMGV